jgi:AbrB family looped-hinge helix DNA binding protein
LNDLSEKIYKSILSHRPIEVITIMKKPTFYGSTTVGERGQIVLPVKLRKDFKIIKGDKLLVIVDPHGSRINLVNPDTMNQFLDKMSENINQMKSKIRQK